MIVINNFTDIEQKKLYFKIDSGIRIMLDTEYKETLKGIYAIFNGDICCYVGQTKNFASRAATHLKGKYEKATHIYFFDIKEMGWSDFDKRNSKTRETILLEVEKYFMSKLKPIDNVDIDIDYVCNKDCTHVYVGSQLRIVIRKGSFYICDQQENTFSAMGVIHEILDDDRNVHAIEAIDIYFGDSNHEYNSIESKNWREK